MLLVPFLAWYRCFGFKNSVMVLLAPDRRSATSIQRRSNVPPLRSDSIPLHQPTVGWPPCQWGIEIEYEEVIDSHIIPDWVSEVGGSRDIRKGRFDSGQTNLEFPTCNRPGLIPASENIYSMSAPPPQAFPSS